MLPRGMITSSPRDAGHYLDGHETPARHTPPSLANSHDGSLAVTMQLTAVRVVCSNTMSVALGSGQKFRALHTPNVISKANEAPEFLGLTEPYFENLMAGINRLVETKINKTQVDEMVFKVFGLYDTKAISEQHFLPRHAAETVKDLFHTGIGNDMKGVKGTAWAAYNAVTEYIDHVRPQGVRLTTARSTAGDLGQQAAGVGLVRERGQDQAIGLGHSDGGLGETGLRSRPAGTGSRR